MWDAFSAAGSLVHRPCGPRKSRMPLSVLMPAPVSTTTRRAAGQPAAHLLEAASTPAGYRPLDDAPERHRNCMTSPDLFHVEERRHADLPTFPIATLTVQAWPDPVIDAVGHDVRSRLRRALLARAARPVRHVAPAAARRRPRRAPRRLSSSTSPSPPPSSVSAPGPGGTRRSSARSTAAAASAPPTRSTSHTLRVRRKLPTAHPHPARPPARGPAGGPHRLDRGAQRRASRSTSSASEPRAWPCPSSSSARTSRPPSGSSTPGASTRRSPTRRWRGPSSGGRSPASFHAGSSRPTPPEDASKGPFGPPPSLATASMIPGRSGQGSG